MSHVRPPSALRRGFPWVALSFLACAETSQERVDIPLYVAGTDVSDSVSSLGDLPLTIERADLAFGPLYLCAGYSAGDLCDTARAEWLSTVVIDTTDEESMAVGSLTGVSGSVRSYMYDLAISSQLTRSKPYVLEAAAELGDASFVVEGRVEISGVEIPFFTAVPIQQNDTSELGVPVIRIGEERFSHEVTGQEGRLTLRFDPTAWMSRMDFRPYIQNETCESSNSPTVCQGQTELTCGEDGSAMEARDCSELGEVCLANAGCRDELVVEEGSETYRSLAIALATTGRPEFDWDDSF